jgi:hypothetical protein
MDDRNVIKIGLRVIKRCGMYAKEYKNWILRENAVPSIVERIDSFKEYLANAIALVNQTAVLVLQHGNGVTTGDNNALLTLYDDSLSNFGATFATTQETMKSLVDNLIAMQGQLANIQKFCMTIGQQPPSSVYAPAQQQHTFNNRNKCNGGSQGSGQGSLQQPTMSFGGTGGVSSMRLVRPLPTSNGRIGTTATPIAVMWTTLTSVQCVANQDLRTTQTQAAPTSWADQSTGMHNNILPLTCGRTPPNHYPQQQQLLQQCPPIVYYPTEGMAWQQP